MVDVIRPQTTRLTNKDRVVAVALSLEGQGQVVFSAETLVIHCWWRWPQHFGMHGYEVQYPDTQKVLPLLGGDQGLVRKGVLSKRGDRTYALTPAGRQSGYEVVEQHRLPFDVKGARFAAVTCQLPPETEAFLTRGMDSEAMSLRTQGREGEITYPEAFDLFGMRPRAQGEEVAAALSEFRQQMLLCVQAFADRPTVVLTNGREVTRREVDGLAGLAGRLEQRYRRHLDLMEQRK